MGEAAIDPKLCATIALSQNLSDRPWQVGRCNAEGVADPLSTPRWND